MSSWKPPPMALPGIFSPLLPAQAKTPRAILMAGATPVNPMAGSRKRWTCRSLPVRSFHCALITSPTPRLTVKVSWWMTFPSPKLDTPRVLNPAMAGGKGLALSVSRTSCRRLSAWLSSRIPAMRQPWTSSPSTLTRRHKSLLHIGSKDVQDVVLVVTATTRFTREQTAYQFEIR